MAKKVLEVSGAGRAKKASAKGAAAKKSAAKPVRARAKKVPYKVPEAEVEKEKKAIEARGLIVKRICVTVHGRMPRRLKSEEEPRAILSYMRPDGLFVSAVVGAPEVPPEMRRPYGVWKRKPTPDMYVKIYDEKAVLR
jgi:hypothetical protein